MIPARERMTLTRLAWSCHAAAPRRGGCAGLPAASRDRGSAVTLDRAGAAGRAHPGRDSRSAVGLLGAADLGRAPGQALAIPVLDLPPRPGLPSQSGRDLGPVP